MSNSVELSSAIRRGIEEGAGEKIKPLDRLLIAGDLRGLGVFGKMRGFQIQAEDFCYLMSSLQRSGGNNFELLDMVRDFAMVAESSDYRIYLESVRGRGKERIISTAASDQLGKTLTYKLELPDKFRLAEIPHVEKPLEKHHPVITGRASSGQLAAALYVVRHSVHPRIDVLKAESPVLIRWQSNPQTRAAEKLALQR